MKGKLIYYQYASQFVRIRIIQLNNYVHNMFREQLIFHISNNNSSITLHLQQQI
jgi:hypothetical protein